MKHRNPLAADLDHILTHTEGLWEALRGQRLFITGGTGFVGCWLLESLLWASDRLGLDVRAVVLTRDPKAFAYRAPNLAGHPAVELYAGDVKSGEFPAGEFTHVIHAATESAGPGQLGPLSLFDGNVQGARRVLEFARTHGVRKLLYTSSGAVYGTQPPGLSHIPEDYAGAPDTADPASAYGQGKRAGEFFCAVYAREHGLAATIARCFAFVGPFLPLDANYAIGNFIRDALHGGPISVTGDGTPWRSYLYAGDLAMWLWTILLRGEPCRPYNVGSEASLTIAELAAEVARVVAPEVRVEIARRADPGAPVQRYVPSTQRAQEELGLRPTVALPEAIERTARWYARRRG